MRVTRRTRFVPALIAAVVMAAAGAAYASIASDAVTALRRASASDSFTFIVWGDNRCRAGALGSPTFSRIIRESNALAPALTVGVGDLISGAEEEDLEWTRAQWLDFAAATKHFRMPCLPVPGNHDLDGPKANAMYEQFAGPRRYALDFGGCRFIILDSQEDLSASSDQFRWLTEQLAAPGRPRRIFLFMHAPLFYETNAAWEPVHLLLRRFPVRAVFAGHDHLYSYGERDGIKYVVTGGAGAPLRDPPERGGFYHYVIVTVRGDAVSLAVAREEAILPADCVRRSDFPLLDKLRDSASAPLVEAPADDCVVATAAAKVRNPGDAIWDGVARWRTGGGWLFEPAQVRFSLAPGEEASLPFTIHVPAPLAARYPLPELVVDYAAQPQRTLSVAMPLRLRNLLRCPRGQAFAGAGVPVSVTPADFFPPAPEDLSATVALRWDPKALHVRISVTDDISLHQHSGDDLWEGDSVQLFFDLANNGNGRGQDKDDHELCAARGARGVEVWRYAGAAGEGPAPKVTCDIADTATGRVYSMAIPWTELAPFAPKPGATFGFSLAVNDDDGLAAGGLTWLELTPGAGAGRTPFPVDAVVLE